jgi:hypothetical protein
MVKIPQIFIILLWISNLASLFQVFQISGYGVVLTDLLMGLMIITVFFQLVVEKRQFRILKGPLTNILYFSILAALLSGIGLIFWGGSVQIFQFAKTFIHYIFFIIFTFLFVVAEVDDDAFYNAIKVVLICAFFVNIFGIYQIFARLYDLPLAWIKITNVSFEQRGMKEVQGETVQLSLRFGNFFRATSFFPEPSALAYYNLFNLLYIVVPFVRGSRPFIKNPVINIIVFISVILGLLTPFSLGGLSGFIVFMFLLIFFEKLKVRKFIIPIILLLITVGIFDYYFQKETQTSIVSLFNERVSGLLSTKPGIEPITGESTPGRLNSFKNAVDIFFTSPIVGIGLGNTYYHPLSNMRFADSSLFAIIAEMGLFGTIIFLGLVFYGTKISLFLRKPEIISNVHNNKLNTLQSIAVYSWILIIFNSFFLANIHITASLWMPLAIILATYKSVLKNLRQNNFDFDKYNFSDYNV